jgi:mRNA interferase MazF
MTRGEIWWADFGVPFGSERGFRRPVLIFQNDLYNNSNLQTTIAIPFTTNELMAEIPGNITLSREDTNLRKNSVLVTPQIGVIDKSRLMEKVSKISSETMAKIENAVLLILGYRQ